MADSHPSVGGIPLVFGGNVFSWTIDRDKSFRVLDAFYEAGGRMIDTADVYGQQPSGDRGGGSEAILGEWIEARGVRKDVLIATKTGMGNPGGLAPATVAASLEGSLERLRTDYVDLFYAHRDDENTPVEDAVAAFDSAFKSGKARELGASNFSAERLAVFLDAAAQAGAQPFSVLQPNYNLAVRSQFEGPLQDLCVARGVAVLPYFGLASGFLTGKYRSTSDWDGKARKMILDGIAAQGGWDVLAVMDEIVAESGLTHAEIALAWLNAQPSIAAPIASATSPEQLVELVKAVSLTLDESQLKRLNAVSPAEA